MARLPLLFLGGGPATLARYGLNGVILQRVATFPMGTMVVNVTGCFLVGFLAAISGPGLGRAWLRPELDNMAGEGLIAPEKVRVIACRRGATNP